MLSCRCSSIAMNSRTEALSGSAADAPERASPVRADCSSSQAANARPSVGVMGGTRSEELNVASRRV